MFSVNNMMKLKSVLRFLKILMLDDISSVCRFYLHEISSINKMRSPNTMLFDIHNLNTRKSYTNRKKIMVRGKNSSTCYLQKENSLVY